MGRPDRSRALTSRALRTSPAENDPSPRGFRMPRSTSFETCSTSTPERSATSCRLAPLTSALQPLQERLLVDGLDAQLHRLVVLRPGVLTHHHEVRVLGNAGGDLGACL